MIARLYTDQFSSAHPGSNADEPRHFYVGLVGYFIEGRPYSADGLTVDGDSAFELGATDDGFS